MNCEQIESKLIAYLDGKADVKQRVSVEAHLAECAMCRVRAEQFRSLWSVLDEMPLAMPSPAFDARVRARVARDHGGMWAWLAPSYRMAFATVALLLLSVWLVSFQPPRGAETATLAEAPAPANETEFGMINNLPVLEDYDVLSNFDALSELPVRQPQTPHVVAPEPAHEM